MTAEGVFAEHKVEGFVQSCGVDLPCDEGAVSQLGRVQRLADAPDDSGFEHGADSFEDDREIHSGEAGDLLKWFAVKPLKAVFGDREDLGVDRIGVIGWNGGGHGAGSFEEASRSMASDEDLATPDSGGRLIWSLEPAPWLILHGQAGGNLGAQWRRERDSNPR